MFYALVRAIIGFAIRLFYRVEIVSHVKDLGGPVMFVGNHPNSLIDPAMVFIATTRPVTFLAREGLFHAPIFGWVLKGLGALPVYRKQDNPNLMAKNEGTLETAANALMQSRAITIFPEGKSHSAPQMSDIKTGCARIALRVAKAGVSLRVIPVGLNYQQKHAFRSPVRVEIGEPILVQAVSSLSDEAEQAWVRTLTDNVGDALRAVTLSLEQWDDLELIATADQLYALRNGVREQHPERLRFMARAASLLRNEQPDRFDDFKEDVMSFRKRLQMVNADAADLSGIYRGREVFMFVIKNLAALFLGFPLFALGLALFVIPYMSVRMFAAVVPVSRDRIATLKFVSALVVTPIWWGLLTLAAWRGWGLPGFAVGAVGVLPLALFTRYFLERWRNVFIDVQVFFRLGNRSRMKQHLLFQGERLQEEIHRLELELKPRLDEQS